MLHFRRLFSSHTACQVVLGDSREIGERDANRSHLLTSTTEDGFSALQSGASHFQPRRNRYG
jgi:hypothetical protein